MSQYNQTELVTTLDGTEQMLLLKDGVLVRANSGTVSSVSSTTQNYTAGEDIASHLAVVLVGGLVYRMNNLNPLHQYNFIGFSSTSGLSGGEIPVEKERISLGGWGLTANQTYLAGIDGGLVTSLATSGAFAKIVGVAQSTDSLLIVKDYTSINKI